MGNSSMFLLLRQKDREDITKLKGFLNLSDNMGREIENFPSPSAMEGDKYSMFAYIHRSFPTDKMGVCVNRMPKEALWIASSNSDEVGAKRELIKTKGNVWKALEEAAA
jgi:hypothetical protein